MSTEAAYTRSPDVSKLLAGATIDTRQAIQLPTGESSFLDDGNPVSSGAYTERLRSGAKATVNKTSGVVLLPGQDAYFDYSARTVTYAPVNDRDYRMGLITDDASSAAISCVVDLNKARADKVSLQQHCFLTSIVGTKGYETMGVFPRGGARKLILSSTNEAQKVDLLSEDGFDPSANAIVEGVFRVVSKGSGSAPDFNIGVANGTHATDADSITEYCFLHMDGNSGVIKAQSKDGTTTVAATDTTKTFTEGSAVAQRVHFLMDLRDLTDIQIYINGVNVLPSTVFKLDAATGPLFLLAHLEKTAAADTFEVDIETLRCWISEQ